MPQAMSKKVIKSLTEMYAHWNQELDADKARIWNRHLVGYDPAKVVLAIDHAVSLSTGFPPRIPDVERALKSMGAKREASPELMPESIEQIVAALERRQVGLIPSMLADMDDRQHQYAVQCIVDWFTSQFADGLQGFHQFMWSLSGADADVFVDFKVSNIQLYLDSMKPRKEAGDES